MHESHGTMRLTLQLLPLRLGCLGVNDQYFVNYVALHTLSKPTLIVGDQVSRPLLLPLLCRRLFSHHPPTPTAQLHIAVSASAPRRTDMLVLRLLSDQKTAQKAPPSACQVVRKAVPEQDAETRRRNRLRARRGRSLWRSLFSRKRAADKDAQSTAGAATSDIDVHGAPTVPFGPIYLSGSYVVQYLDASQAVLAESTPIAVGAPTVRAPLPSQVLYWRQPVSVDVVTSTDHPSRDELVLRYGTPAMGSNSCLCLHSLILFLIGVHSRVGASLDDPSCIRVRVPTGRTSTATFSSSRAPDLPGDYEVRLLQPLNHHASPTPHTCTSTLISDGLLCFRFACR